MTSSIWILVSQLVGKYYLCFAYFTIEVHSIVNHINIGVSSPTRAAILVMYIAGIQVCVIMFEWTFLCCCMFLFLEGQVAVR